MGKQIYVDAGFYADDGILASPLNEDLQDALDILVELFERVELRTNVTKTKAINCVKVL